MNIEPAIKIIPALPLDSNSERFYDSNIDGRQLLVSKNKEEACVVERTMFTGLNDRDSKQLKNYQAASAVEIIEGGLTTFT